VRHGSNGLGRGFTFFRAKRAGKHHGDRHGDEDICKIENACVKSSVREYDEVGDCTVMHYAVDQVAGTTAQNKRNADQLDTGSGGPHDEPNRCGENRGTDEDREDGEAKIAREPLTKAQERATILGERQLHVPAQESFPGAGFERPASPRFRSLVAGDGREHDCENKRKPQPGWDLCAHAGAYVVTKRRP
jgi:hypothetical protein